MSGHTDGLIPAVEASKKASKWTTFRASDGELAIRQRTEDEWIEAMVEAAAPILLAALDERYMQEIRQLQEAFRASDFRAIDYSQRIIAAAAVMDDELPSADWATEATFTRIRAALKLGDD